MRKITCSKFELDLSPLGLTDIEVNSIFEENIFSKITFPFEINITDDLDIAFDFIQSYTTNPETVYEVFYSHHEILSKGTLEVIEFTAGKLSLVLEFGLENFPSWDTKLSALALDKFELPDGVTIYEHAETIIPLSYPTTNYNFPQIHTDKIDTDDEIWLAFNKIINNRVAGVFLENEVDLVEEITYNRNIMQPVPYLLHVLKKGVEVDGFTLAGDILTDEDLQQQTLYGDVEYFTTITQESISIILDSASTSTSGYIPSFPFTLGENFQKFTKVVAIDNPGKYRIKGTIYIFPLRFNYTTVVIKYRGSIIYSKSTKVAALVNTFPININVIFETLADLLPNDITIEILQRPTVDEIICQLDVNPIRLHDVSGEAIANIINLNEVNLPKSMPDVTFGDLITFIKTYFNYDFYPQGNVILMNKVKVNATAQNLISLENKEVKYPSRTFQKKISFLLKFTDFESKEYEFLPIFQSALGVFNNDYKTDDKTISKEINGLPLPLLLRNGVQTAHAFENNNSKFYLIKYTGLISGKNLSQDNTSLTLPIIHEKNHKEFMDFMINATTYKWEFNSDVMPLIQLNSKSKVFAYQNYHVVKTIEKTELENDIFQYAIETQSL